VSVGASIEHLLWPSVCVCIYFPTPLHLIFHGPISSSSCFFFKEISFLFK
jgi:hypothetical protein